MSSIFCCSGVKPYRPQRLDSDRETKFQTFTNWSDFPKSSSIESNADEQVDMSNTYAIQVVQQVNFGPLESKRYFVATKYGNSAFVEVTEQHLIDANYQKVNSYKNFKCEAHNKFFEYNLYMKDPINKHHWRANIARPAGEIDL